MKSSQNIKVSFINDDNLTMDVIIENINEKIPDKTYLLSLVLQNCPNFEELDLSMIPINFKVFQLTVSNCNSLTTLKGFKEVINCNKFVIESCNEIEEFDNDLFNNLRLINTISFADCKKLRYIPELNIGKSTLNNLDVSLDFYFDNIMINNLVLKSHGIESIVYVKFFIKNLPNLRQINKDFYNCGNKEICQRFFNIKHCPLLVLPNQQISTFITFNITDCNIPRISVSNIHNISITFCKLKSIDIDGYMGSITLDNNYLTSLDLSKVIIISGNSLSCNSNYIRDIKFNISKFSNIKVIAVENNELTSLNLLNFRNIETLYARDNPLRKLFLYTENRNIIYIDYLPYYPICNNSKIGHFYEPEPDFTKKITDDLSSKTYSELTDYYENLYSQLDFKESLSNFNTKISSNKFDPTDFGLDLVRNVVSQINKDGRSKLKNIRLPSINFLKTLSLPDMNSTLDVFTPSEINRAYGPFIYKNFDNNIVDQVYNKIHNVKTFYLVGNDNDKLDLINYNSFFDDIRINFKNKTILTIKEIINLTIRDKSGNIKIQNPLYQEIDILPDMTYEELVRQEELANNGINKFLLKSEIKELTEFLEIIVKSSLYVYKLSYRPIISSYYQELLYFIDNNTNIYEEYRQHYLLLNVKDQEDVKMFFWEFFIYVIWSRHWKGWYNVFPMIAKNEECHNQIRFMNFSVNQQIINDLYNNMSVDAKNFIMNIAMVNYRWEDTYKIDHAIKNIPDLIRIINSNNCMGITGDLIIGSIYLDIVLILLDSDFTIKTEADRQILAKNFNEEFKIIAPKLIDLEISVLKDRIHNYYEHEDKIYQSNLRKFLDKGISKANAKIQTDLVMEKLTDLRDKRYNKEYETRLQKTLEFIKDGYPIPTFYPDQHHIKLASHYENEIYDYTGENFEEF